MAYSTFKPLADQSLVVERPDTEPIERQRLRDKRPLRRHQLMMDSDDIDEALDALQKTLEATLLCCPLAID